MLLLLRFGTLPRRAHSKHYWRDCLFIFFFTSQL